ncbi:hypothetical protein C9374_001950 [Naegleria lovaniensis]|uniref:WH2 domain-containing protein n=1 Tax=Naegleria lovaniensis TaxID=51637 RepID=A0AA88GQ85_NAELO|nr:uncharacterized protein C9374_001950 [Naegleria lovaniensis]KAG2386915.1 hypothetical protein C9374_001950 [Naegleria lovaniensis]
MVVIKRPLEHFDRCGFSQNNTGASLIESSRISGHMLQGRNMNSMTGVLYQLSALATTASEIFNSLSESARGTFDRINALNTRIQQINNKLPEYEQFMHNNNNKLLFSASGYELTEANIAVLYRKDHSNISKENNPLPLNLQYTNACLPAPEFSPLLDQLHEWNSQQQQMNGSDEQGNDSKQQQGGASLPKYKKCIEAYTDSNFFFNEWAKRELERLKKAKQKRKEERKRQRMERQNVTVTKEKKQVKQMKIHRKKYNSEGQIIDSGNSSGGSGSGGNQMQRVASSAQMSNSNSNGYPQQDSSPRHTPQQQQQTSSYYETSSPNAMMNHSYETSSYSAVPTPPPMMNSTNSRSVPPPPPMNGGYGSSPMMNNSNNGYSTPPPPPKMNTGGGSGGGYGVPPPPSNVPTPPPMMNTGSVPPPPPKVMNVPPPPPSNNFVVTPPPVAATTGEGNIDILKTVESNKSQMNRVAVTGRANLLDEIRTGKALKSVAERKLEPKKEEGGAMSVADILSKKFEKVMGDSDDEDSDTDFSDSDW